MHGRTRSAEAVQGFCTGAPDLPWRGDLLGGQGDPSTMANDSTGSFIRIILDAEVGAAPRKGSWRTQPEPFVDRVITKTVPYAECKVPNIKGKKKLNQFVRKRLMQHAMDMKSGYIQTKEGPAVISYGTYGPNGKLEY